LRIFSAAATRAAPARMRQLMRVKDLGLRLL